MGPEKFAVHLQELKADLKAQTEKLRLERIAFEQQIAAEKKQIESLNRSSKSLKLIMKHHDLIKETIETHGITATDAETKGRIKKELIHKMFKAEHELLVFAGNWLNAVLVIFCASLIVGCIAHLPSIIITFVGIIVINLLCIGVYRCVADVKKAEIYRLTNGYIDEKFGAC